MNRREVITAAAAAPVVGVVGAQTEAAQIDGPFVWRFRSLGYERAAVINPTDGYCAEYTYLMADGTLVRASRLHEFRVNIADRHNSFDRDGWHKADLAEFDARVRGYVIACFVEDDGHWTRCLW